MSESENLVRERLNAYFETTSKADFCRDTGIHTQNLKNWMGGTTIPVDVLDAMAKGMGYAGAWELLKPDGSLLVQRKDKSALIGELVVAAMVLKEDKLLTVVRFAQRLVRGLNKAKNITDKNR